MNIICKNWTTLIIRLVHIHPDPSQILGDGVDGVDDARNEAEDGEQQADPELMLQIDFPLEKNSSLNHFTSSLWRNLICETHYSSTRTPHPNLRKTPSGGRMMATRMSTQSAVPMASFSSCCDQVESGTVFFIDGDRDR
jgi:hypothetical protein